MLVAALCTSIAPPIGWDDLCFRPSSHLPITSFAVLLIKDRFLATSQDFVYFGSGSGRGETRWLLGLLPIRVSRKDSSLWDHCSIFEISSSFHSTATSQTQFNGTLFLKMSPCAFLGQKLRSTATPSYSAIKIRWTTYCRARLPYWRALECAHCIAIVLVSCKAVYIFRFSISLLITVLALQCAKRIWTSIWA